MKIALLGLGRGEIPDVHMGSVENLMWNYKVHLEELGHTVDIYNSIWIHETIYALNNVNYDFIHSHSDVHILYFQKYLKNKYCLTSHCGGFSKFVPGKFDFYPAFNFLFKDSLLSPGHITISQHITDLYVENQYKGFLKTFRNPVEVGKFDFKEKATYNKAICLGKIQPRKKQALLANIAKGKI